MRILAAAFVGMLGCETALAQIQVDRFYPPVVSAGQMSLVQAEGKFPKWPAKFVCDRDDVQIAAADESGKLNVTIPASSAPGVTWVRCYDETSASQWVALLVESIPATPEVEPNNKIADATNVESVSVIYARLEKNGDVDTYRMNAKKDETFVLSVIAHRFLRSPMDMVLQLVDKQGNVLAQVDDVCGMDPQLVYTADEDMELFGRVFAFPETPNSTISYAGAASFVYQLRVTNQSFVDHTLPLVAVSNSVVEPSLFGWNLPAKTVTASQRSTLLAPAMVYSPSALGWQYQAIGPHDSRGVVESNDASTTRADSIPFIFSGHISLPGETDRVRFPGTKGTKYRATVHSRDFGFSMDSALSVTSMSDAKEIVRNDDQERDVADAAIEFTASEDGEYELTVSDIVDGYGPRHAYSVVFEESQPVIRLIIAADHFEMKAGESLDIAVSIQRKYGFDKKLRVSVENLPDGVKAEPVVSEVKGDSSKSVTLKLTAEKEVSFSGNVQIVGQPLDTDGNAIGSIVAAVHRIDSLIEVHDLWLTVIKGQ